MQKLPHPAEMTIRLAKRVAEQLACSRSMAEQFIEGGFVSVNGQLVEAPGARGGPHPVVPVAQNTSQQEKPPHTLQQHKPPRS